MAAETSGGLIKSSFTIHPDQLARLDRVARDRHISKSLILREALEKELDRLESGAPVLEPAAVA